MSLTIADPTAMLRMLLVYAHLLAMIGAGVGIAFGDYAIFARRRLDAALLRLATRSVTLALLALWVTGLAIIGIDTGYQWSVLTSQPKLLAKLTVVIALTANGAALHHIVFHRLLDRRRQPPGSQTLSAMLGAISLVTWLFAIFVGLAGPASGLLGYSGFMVLYVTGLAVGVTASLWLIRPRLGRRLANAPG